MKKLLSLLSVLTISGTAVPTTIASSPYQKKETIKNIDISYQQTNNSEKLKRNKRNPQWSWGWGNANLKITNNCDNLKNKIINKDLHIINDDTDEIILNIFKEKNNLNSEEIGKFRVYSKTNTSAIIENTMCNGNGSIVSTGPSQKINVSYFIKRNLDDITLPINNWINEIKDWKYSMDRQFRENFPSMSIENKLIWKENYISSFKLRLVSLSNILYSIQNRVYIKQIFGRIQGLENSLSDLKRRIEELEKSNLSVCSSSFGFVAAISAPVPAIGTAISTTSTLISSSCGLINEF